MVASPRLQGAERVQCLIESYSLLRQAAGRRAGRCRPGLVGFSFWQPLKARLRGLCSGAAELQVVGAAWQALDLFVCVLRELLCRNGIARNVRA